MTDTTSESPGHELPLFPTRAPEVFSDPRATWALFEPVLARLAEMVEVDDDQLAGPTPCPGFTVVELRRHVLGWLQFFAAALCDPDGNTQRPDPEAWDLDPDESPGRVVEAASAKLATAIGAGAAGRMVVMSQARMAGDGVLAMALGEYAVHGWDLATATGRSWLVADDTAEAALAFLRSIVAPEHRGPDSGFFGHEVPAPAAATPLERLLCFGGRRPDWSPVASRP